MYSTKFSELLRNLLMLLPILRTSTKFTEVIRLSLNFAKLAVLCEICYTTGQISLETRPWTYPWTSMNVLKFQISWRPMKFFEVLQYSLNVHEVHRTSTIYFEIKSCSLNFYEWCWFLRFINLKYWLRFCRLQMLYFNRSQNLQSSIRTGNNLLRCHWKHTQSNSIMLHSRQATGQSRSLSENHTRVIFLHMHSLSVSLPTIRIVPFISPFQHMSMAIVLQHFPGNGRETWWCIAWSKHRTQVETKKISCFLLFPLLLNLLWPPPPCSSINQMDVFIFVVP